MCEFLTAKDVQDPVRKSLFIADSAIKDKAMNNENKCDFEIPNRSILCDVVSSLKERGFCVDIDDSYVYSPYIVISVSW